MSASNAVVPFEQLHTMAAAFAKSGMFGAKTPEQAMSLLLLAQAEGVHPAIAMRDFDIINGRPSKKAEAMQRSFLAAGGTIKWHRYEDDGADATFSHPQGGTLRVSWDVARARKAGLASKDMYGKYSRAMFGARVISEGVRKVYPAATSGLYTPQEAAAMEPKEKDMGRAQVVEQEEDVTERIHGVGTPADAQASPAPQETPNATPAPSLASGAAPDGAAFITTDQAMLLAEKCAKCDPEAEKSFLRIAKIAKLTELKAEHYDEALDWVERRVVRLKKSA